MNKSMLTVYAVRVINGEKHRHMIGTRSSIEEAKHLCNCAVLGNADYAYVKDFGDGTVFYMKAEPSPYGEGDFPLEQCRPISQASDYDEQPLMRPQNPLLVDPKSEDLLRKKYQDIHSQEE